MNASTSDGNVNDFNMAPMSFDDPPPSADDEAQIVTKKDLYGVTVKVNALLSHIDLLSVKKSEEAVSKHKKSVENLKDRVKEMLAYVEKDSDQLHGKFQAVEMKIRDWEKAQSSELTKQVSELTSENENLKKENQALASDNMEMSIRLKEYEIRLAEKDKLLTQFMDQNQNLTKQLLTMNES